MCHTKRIPQIHAVPTYLFIWGTSSKFLPKNHGCLAQEYSPALYHDTIHLRASSPSNTNSEACKFTLLERTSVFGYICVCRVTPLGKVRSLYKVWCQITWRKRCLTGMANSTITSISKTPIASPPGDNCLVILHGNVDLSSFKKALPPQIRTKIIGQWTIADFKGVVGTFFSWPSFSFGFSL